jgi:hypothetical protein
MPDVQYIKPKQWSNFFNQETLDLISTWISGSVDAEVLLYVNNIAPGPTVNLGGLTEATFGGYSRQSIASWYGPGLDSTNQGFLFGTTVLFQGNGDGPSNIVTGAAIVANNGGTQATGTVVLTGTAVTSVTITNGGTLYESPPAVTFVGGTGTVTATGVAVLTNGVVTSITITNGGDYSVAPTVTIAKPESLVVWGPFPNPVSMNLSTDLLPFTPQIPLPSVQAA